MDARLRKATIFVVVFDSACFHPGRFFSTEVDLISRLVGRPEYLVIPVLVNGTSPAALPASLRECHAIHDSTEDEQIRVLVERARGHRRVARTKLGTALLGSALVAFGVAFVAFPEFKRLVDCQSIYSDTESSKLREFAAEASQVWVIGQTLSHISNNERDFLLDKVAKRGEVRILFMRTQPWASMPTNPGILVMRRWSANEPSFAEQIAVSESVFRQWLDTGAASSGHIEIRQMDIIPFSANVIDWGHPERAALQERPHLYKSSATDRPLFEFSRTCNAKTFDKFVGTLEAAWDGATPLERVPAGQPSPSEGI